MHSAQFASNIGFDAKTLMLMHMLRIRAHWDKAKYGGFKAVGLGLYACQVQEKLMMGGLDVIISRLPNVQC